MLPSPGPGTSPRPAPWRRLLTVAVVALMTTAAVAQDDKDKNPDPPPDPNLYTLHVYNNLVQFPTIVLHSDLTPLPPIPREKFNITLDGGPVFHPTLMRLEGDDPISLAILLDATGAQSYMVHNFADSLAALAPGFLKPRDHVSIYSQDCRIMRSVHDQPADSKLLRDGTTAALSAPHLHGDSSKPACAKAFHLWDSLTVISQDLAQTPGRRVILVVSLGFETKSTTSFQDAASFAGGHGVAVFGLRDSDEWAYSGHSRRATLPPGLSTEDINPYDYDLFGAFCTRSGGLVLYTTHRALARQLQDFITLLRRRYILEFPRPDDATAARHEINVTIPGTLALIRPTGASTPLPDPALLADPTTLRSPSTPAILGTRHPQDPKH